MNAREWYYAPHFHIVGFGWRTTVHRAYGKFGWFVKDLGVRESVFQTGGLMITEPDLGYCQTSLTFALQAGRG